MPSIEVKSLLLDKSRGCQESDPFVFLMDIVGYCRGLHWVVLYCTTWSLGSEEIDCSVVHFILVGEDWLVLMGGCAT